MIQYQIYLRAELAKLADQAEARRFLAVSAAFAERCGLPDDPARLAQRLSSQGAVDDAVAAMNRDCLLTLTMACARWRRNGMDHILRPDQRVAIEIAEINRVLTGQAEPHLATLFAENGWRLQRIARDARTLADPAYASHRVGEPVAQPTCIAQREPDGTRRVVDGIHRAVQLVRNGEKVLHLCVIE